MAVFKSIIGKCIGGLMGFAISLAILWCIAAALYSVIAGSTFAAANQVFFDWLRNRIA